MENLPKLIKQRNHLQSSMPSLLDLKEHLSRGVSGINELRQDTLGYHTQEIEQQIGCLDDCLRSLDLVIQSRKKLLDSMEEDLRDMREPMLQKEWQSRMNRVDLEQHWHGVDYLAAEEIGSRIALEFTWQCPALLINCHDRDILETMAGYPQLYIADINAERLAQCQERFRLDKIDTARAYQIGYEWDDLDLSKLPHHQFGIVVAWYFTEHLGVYQLSAFLRKVRKLMRPGGRILFNANDADTSQGAQWAVEGFKHYMTREMIDTILKEADLNMLNCLRTSTSGLMVEAQAPGELSLIKEQPSRFQVKRY